MPVIDYLSDVDKFIPKHAEDFHHAICKARDEDFKTPRTKNRLLYEEVLPYIRELKEAYPHTQISIETNRNKYASTANAQLNGIKFNGLKSCVPCYLAWLWEKHPEIAKNFYLTAGLPFRPYTAGSETSSSASPPTKNKSSRNSYSATFLEIYNTLLATRNTTFSILFLLSIFLVFVFSSIALHFHVDQADIKPSKEETKTLSLPKLKNAKISTGKSHGDGWRLEHSILLAGCQTNKGCSVTSIDFSHNKKYIAFSRSDGLGFIWDVKSQKVVSVLRGHLEAINDIAISNNGELAFTVGTDNTARIWDTLSGNEVKVLKGHSNRHPTTKGILSLSLSPDNTLIATGGSDGNVVIWDVASGREIRRFQWQYRDRIKSLQFEKKGKEILASSDTSPNWVFNAFSGKMVSKFDDSPSDYNLGSVFLGSRERVLSFNPAKIKNVFDGTELGKFTHPLLDADYNPKRGWIAAASWGGTIHIWDGNNRTELLSINVCKANTVRFLPETENLVIGCRSKDAKIVSLNTPKKLPKGESWVVSRKITAKCVPDSSARNLPCYTLDAYFFDNDEKIVTSHSDGYVRVWEYRTGVLLHELEIVDKRFYKRGYIYTGDISIKVRNHLLATISSSGNRKIMVWDARKGVKILEVPAIEKHFREIKFSRNGKFIIAYYQKPVIQAIRIDATAKQGFLNTDQYILNSADTDHTDRFVVSVGYKNSPKVWDFATGELIKNFDFGQNRNRKILGSLFFPNDTRFLTYGEGGISRIWDLNKGEIVRFGLHGGTVHSGKISPNGEFAATAGGGRIRVWDTVTGQQKFAFPSGKVFVFDEQGTHLYIARKERQHPLVQIVSLYDGHTRSKIFGHKGEINSIHLGSVGTKILTSSDDGSAIVWRNIPDTAN